MQPPKTVWNYKLTTDSWDGLTFNVVYDLFTTATASLTAAHTSEIMVWTSNHNMVPPSTKDASGNPVPLASNLVLDGYAWFVTIFPDRVDRDLFS